MLQSQNELQEKLILQLAHFVSSTMVKMSEHQEVLYDLDTYMMILDKALSNMEAVSHLQFTVAILTDICKGISRLRTRLPSLKENNDAVYEHMRPLASHAFNALLYPNELYNIHVHEKQGYKG